MCAARVGNGRRDVAIDAGGKRDVRCSQKRTAGRIGVGLDPSAEAAGGNSEGDRINAGQVDGVEPDRSSIVHVDNIQSSSGGVSGGGSGDAVEDAAELGLFMSWLENVGG